MVLDRATYHTVLDEEDRRPVTSWNKKKLADALKRWDVFLDDWPLTWEKTKTKSQLLEQARIVYPTLKYKIQKVAEKFESDSFDIRILLLPVAHPELNPIEMVWSRIKIKISQKNFKFSLSSVEEGTRKEIESVTAEDFKKHVTHAMKEEVKFKELSSQDTE